MIAVIGCGNPNRSDDGVAAAVLRLLTQSRYGGGGVSGGGGGGGGGGGSGVGGGGTPHYCHCEERSDEAIPVSQTLRHNVPHDKPGRPSNEHPTPPVKFLDAGTDGMAVMFAARGCRSLIIVDSCRSNSPPGAIFELPGHELEHRHAPTMTLHDFRWEHALFAGRQLFRDEFPHDVTVLLIEAASVEYGTELTPPVAAAAHTVAARIEAMLRTRIADAKGHAVAG